MSPEKTIPFLVAVVVLPFVIAVSMYIAKAPKHDCYCQIKIYEGAARCEEVAIKPVQKSAPSDEPIPTPVQP